jgi:hypothetical protein
MFLKLIFSLLILFFLFSCKSKREIEFAFQTKKDKNYYNSGRQAVKSFKYNGEYINPLLIGQFRCFESDDFPYFREMDLTASNESNRFYLDTDPFIEKSISNKNIEYFTFKPQNSEDESKNEFEFSKCGYRFLGTLKNGVQVIYYYENSYGSYNPSAIYGFKFYKVKVKGDKIPHIFMRLENSEGINQVADYKVDSLKNRVLVIPESNLPSADFSNLSSSPYWVNFE